ncbi:unnamed protein product [Plutella xylostella]|uniref:(diamondback moth) hypothetical protein n=1 Tax=Plutella xylostella TaxID=51655 RepID=A0A8S4DRT2_PLUXY|nr:unnamed protein product [Plutella xylostella]
MLSQLCLLAVLAAVHGDVSHLPSHQLEASHHQEASHQLESHESTPPPPPRPYAFSYTAGRFPGHSDRHHAEVSDGSGVVRGTYSYVDPGHKVRRVDYVADREGFHPVLSHAPPEHPVDSDAVAQAKLRHHELYEKIAAEHASNPHPQVPLRQSAAVLAATQQHASLFRVIAEQHARIAAERELLQAEQQLQELGEEH